MNARLILAVTGLAANVPEATARAYAGADRSAHRTPGPLEEYIAGAEAAGTRDFITMAGMAQVLADGRAKMARGVLEADAEVQGQA